MSQMTDNYCRRTALLLSLLEGDFSHCVSEAGKDEIRRVLHYVEPGPEPVLVQLAEADE